jgi:phenylalanyl-tRNA synthetase alpha subunit
MSEITNTPVETTQEIVQDTAPVEKTFTQTDLDAIITKRLERERKEAETRIKAAVTEAQKLAKMSADERMEHERAEREKELKNRETEITKRELRAEAKSQLHDKGLPVELADVLPYTDAETTNTALEAVEKVFRAAVEKGINERLKGNPPKVNTPTVTGDSVQDEIRKTIFGK